MNFDPTHIFDLPRRDLKQIAKAIDVESRAFGTAMQKIAMPDHVRPGSRKMPVEIWRSRHYLVQVFVHEGWTRISVNRTAIDVDSRRWADGITWDALQRIKREIGRGECIQLITTSSMSPTSATSGWCLARCCLSSGKKRPPLANQRGLKISYQRNPHSDHIDRTCCKIKQRTTHAAQSDCDKSRQWPESTSAL